VFPPVLLSQNKMKETYYFQHDYNAANDEKLLMLRAEYGAEAYGVWWMLLESMAMASDSSIHRVAIGGLSLGYGVAKGRLTEIVDYCIGVGLLKESQGGAIFSPRMMQHKAVREELSKAGKRGAEKRWNLSQENRVANGKGKERKGNNKKESKKEKKDFVGTSVPTPSQQARDFFNRPEMRQQYITKAVQSGYNQRVLETEINKFVSYWTELNKSGTKQRWETEKTFEVIRRLSTWLNRSSQYSS